MSRGLSSAVKTQLASGSFVMAHLVKLELNSTYYYTDFSSDIVDGSDTYSANGFLQGLGSITESSRMNIGFLSLTISGVNQTITSDVLNNGHLHRPVTIKRAILDSDMSVVGSFAIYSGYIESMSMKDFGVTSSVNFGVANHWSDFERREGRRTNDSSQQHYFNGDLFFEFTDQVGKKTHWGNLQVVEDEPLTYTYEPFGEDEIVTDQPFYEEPIEPMDPPPITEGTGGIVTPNFGAMT